MPKPNTQDDHPALLREQSTTRFFVLGSFVQACCWMVERLPIAGESVVASGLHIEPGGKGLNVAIGIARLARQGEVSIVLGVGRDEPAAKVRQLLAYEGVVTDHVHGLAEQSGYGSGHIAKSGANAIAVFAGPNLLLTEYHADLARTSIVNADLVYAQFETSQPVILRTLELAKQAKKDRTPITVLNPSPWQDIKPELLQWVDVLVVNEIEAAQLLDLPYPLTGLELKVACDLISTTLPKLWAKWPLTGHRYLVVTLGDKGSACFCSNGAVFFEPGFTVTAADTTGCGDAFTGALCEALASGQKPEQALRQANACGALVASQTGVLSALPNLADLTVFLNRESGR
ncbi:MAG: hypothetical protein CFE44_08885 [Burkholderiales bacterium PBB4]|nr:MAG: hypothetical protein CFE44_08885 [Burkholderiales bacterium PBB4]